MGQVWSPKWFVLTTVENWSWPTFRDGARGTYHRGLNGRGGPRKNLTTPAPELVSAMS